MYKRWKLSSNQYVSFVSQKYVEYSHRRHGRSYSVCLSFCQVDILKDIIHLITVKGKETLYIPLGNGIVFMMKNTNRPCIQHFTRRGRRYFMFDEEAWHRYIAHVHPELMTFVRYDRRCEDCQCALANEVNQSRGYTDAVSSAKARRRQYRNGSESRQVLFRTTTHDAVANEGNNHSLFQRRCRSVDRQASDFDSGFEDERDDQMDIANEDEVKDCEH